MRCVPWAMGVFPFVHPVADDLLIKIPGKVEATSEHPNIVT
jgi:hypothetical protein